MKERKGGARKWVRKKRRRKWGTISAPRNHFTLGKKSPQKYLRNAHVGFCCSKLQSFLRFHRFVLHHHFRFLSESRSPRPNVLPMGEENDHQQEREKAFLPFSRVSSRKWNPSRHLYAPGAALIRTRKEHPANRMCFPPPPTVHKSPPRYSPTVVSSMLSRRRAMATMTRTFTKRISSQLIWNTFGTL